MFGLFYPINCEAFTHNSLVCNSSNSGQFRNGVVNVNRKDPAGSAREMANAIASAVDDMSATSTKWSSGENSKGHFWGFADGFLNMITSCSVGDNFAQLSRVLSDDRHYSSHGSLLRNVDSESLYLTPRSSPLSIVKEDSRESGWDEKTQTDLSQPDALKRTRTPDVSVCSNRSNSMRCPVATVSPPAVRRSRLGGRRSAFA